MSDHFRLLRDLSAVREIVTLLMKPSELHFSTPNNHIRKLIIQCFTSALQTLSGVVTLNQW